MDMRAGTRESEALFFEYRGRLLTLAGQPAAAITAFETSMDLLPVATNTSTCPLAQAYRQAGETSALAVLKSRFPDHQCLQDVPHD